MPFIHYTPAQIAAELGVTPQTIRAFLRERFPGHKGGKWWQLNRAEYEITVRELRAAQAVSEQPLRQIRRESKRARGRR